MAIQKQDRFVFYTRLHLTELTGLKASNLKELAGLIKKVPGSSIYHHTHRFLQQHQYLSPEPPNDFAYWVADILAEKELAEKLSSINTVEFSTIHALREKLAHTVAAHVKSQGRTRARQAKHGDEFHFMKSVSFVMPTKYSAGTLAELAQCLEKVTIDAIYFHMFEAKLRLDKDTNDISNWLRGALKQKRLAEELEMMDPYTFTMEQLRRELIRHINSHAGEQNG